jgi:hypothetical protein
MSAAAWEPTSLGRNHERPQSGARARLMKMVLKRASSLAMRISNVLQRPKPPPTVTPLTAAMVGFSAW